MSRGLPSVLKNRTGKQLQYTLSGSVQNTTVTVVADGVYDNVQPDPV